jgi:photosystem II stability/assembly factor-like uncharacterized protein
MKKIFLLIFITISISAYSQTWMRAPFLDKPVEEASYYDIVNAFNMWWGDRPYEKGKGFMPFRRWEYINSFRCYPDGSFPSPDTYWNTYQTIVQEYKANKDFYEKTDVSNWTPMGLTSWDNGINGYNPGNGRVNTVTVDPDNSQTLFIASASGGVWKSTDGGQSWNTTFDQMSHLGVSSIAIHPDSSNVVFVGTGDRDAYDTKATGIYKSTDGGNTWNPSGLNTTGWNSINKIVFNPQNTTVMFAATNYGIYRSTNRGQNWTIVYNQSRVTDLLYHPTDTTIMYGCGDFFVRSTNGGTTFSKDLTVPNDTCRVEIAVTPASANTVYILACNSESSYGGVYRSNNSGASFTLMSSSPNYLGYSMDADDDAGQGWYDLAIAASPSNANEIYIGGINVWKSTNGGSSFNIKSHWVYDDPSFYTHADIHYLGFYGNRLFCGSDGGVFFSDDYAENWTDISEGLGITQFYRISSSPVDPDFIVAGAQDNGSNKLEDGQWTHLFGADGMGTMTHRTDINTYYFSYQFGGLMRTTDNGITVDYIEPGASGAWVTPFDMHPTSSNIIYAGYDEVYKSSNQGDNWIQISSDLTGGATLARLKVSPVNPNYIYASRLGTLYITTDGGANWTSSYSGYNGTIVGIALSYTDPEKLWVAISGSSGDRVFMSEDAGLTYINITGNASGTGIRSLVHQKDYHDALYIGTENAVFYRDTTMVAWIPFVNGLPNVIVMDLEINYSNDMLRAGTYGRGIWETPIPTLASLQEYTIYEAISLFPNPAKGVFNIDLTEIANIQSIGIFDVNGRRILELSAESEIQQVDMTGYVSGVYFIKVISDNNQYVQRFILHN